ncbi:hypothetical protein HDU96_001440 [Phlyctochytrium bullatum]|nr:hypothetical protein HDU96_001440 [Phlyctochytrium bullatum]
MSSAPVAPPRTFTLTPGYSQQQPQAQGLEYSRSEKQAYVHHGHAKEVEPSPPAAMSLLALRIGDGPDKAFIIDVDATAPVARLRSTVATALRANPLLFDLYSVRPGAGLLVDDARLSAFVAAHPAGARLFPVEVQTHLPVLWLTDPGKAVQDAFAGAVSAYEESPMQRGRVLHLLVAVHGDERADIPPPMVMTHGLTINAPPSYMASESSLPSPSASTSLGATAASSVGPLPDKRASALFPASTPSEKAAFPAMVDAGTPTAPLFSAAVHQSAVMYGSSLSSTSPAPPLSDINTVAATTASSLAYTAPVYNAPPHPQYSVQPIQVQQPGWVGTPPGSVYQSALPSTSAYSPAGYPQGAPVPQAQMGPPMVPVDDAKQKQKQKRVIIWAVVAGVAVLVLVGVGVGLGLVLSRQQGGGAPPAGTGTAASASGGVTCDDLIRICIRDHKLNAVELLHNLRLFQLYNAVNEYYHCNDGGRNTPNNGFALSFNPLTGGTTFFATGATSQLTEYSLGSASPITYTVPQRTVYASAQLNTTVLALADVAALSFHALSTSTGRLLGSPIASLTSYLGSGRDVATHELRFLSGFADAAVAVVNQAYVSGISNPTGVVIIATPSGVASRISYSGGTEGYPWCAALVSSTRLLVGVSTGDLHEYQASSSGWTRVNAFRAHRSDLRTMAVAPTGGWVVTGGFDDAIRVWDLQSLGGTAVAEATGFGGEVYEVKVNGPEDQVVAGGNGGRLRSFFLPTRGASAALQERWSTTLNFEVYRATYSDRFGAWLVGGRTREIRLIKN